MEKMKERLLQEIDSLKPEIFEISKTIFEFAEPGWAEFKSSAYLAEKLNKKGFKVQKPIAGLETAFRAEFAGKGKGPAVAFCAEYDAIPNLGHGCGHNLISAGAMGAGMALSRLLPELNGTAIVMGTPAEEGGGGKILMLEGEAFDGVDICMELHGHPIDTYTVSRTCNALQEFSVELRGRGPKKGAPPYDEVNAIDACNLFTMAIGILRQQIGTEARIQYVIEQAGESPNTIPQRANLKFWVRAGTNEHLLEIIEKVKSCASQVAASIGAEAEVKNFGPFFPSLLQNLGLEGVIRKNIEMLGLPFQETEIVKDIVRYYAEKNYHGPHGTDLGSLSQTFPTAHIKVGLGHDFVFHTRAAMEIAGSEKAKDVLMSTTKVMALTALNFFLNPSLVDQCKQELRDYKSGKREVPSWHVEKW
jgi:amidohydrolase